MAHARAGEAHIGSSSRVQGLELTTTSIMQLVPTLLLLACLTTPAYCGAWNITNSLFQQPYAESAELHPTCFNILLACQAECSELKLKSLHHHVPKNSAEVEVLVSAYWYCVLALAFICLSMAVHCRLELHKLRQRFAQREGYLQMRCQGIQDQAFEFAKQLQKVPSSRPNSRAGCNTGRPASRQSMASPSGRAPAGGQSPASRYHPTQGTPPATAGILPPPPGRASMPIAPTSQPSANGFSALVVAAGAHASDTGAVGTDQHSTSLHVPGASSADKGSPAKSPTKSPSAGFLQPPIQQSPCCPAQHPGSTAAMPSPVNSPPGICAAHAGSNSSLPLMPSSPAAMAATGATSQQQWLPTPPGDGAMPFTPPHSTAKVSGVAGGDGLSPNWPHQLADSVMMMQQPATSEHQGLGVGQHGPALQLSSPAAHAWVTTSRGSGTPAVFGGSDSLGFTPQQHQQVGSTLAGSTPPPDVLLTPGTGSTTRSAGTNVHSIAGSCGGSVAAHTSSKAAGLSPPGSATSAASGRTGGSSGGQLTPGRHGAAVLRTLSYVEELVAASKTRRIAAQEQLRERERLHGSPRKDTPTRQPRTTMAASSSPAAAASPAGAPPGVSPAPGAAAPAVPASPSPLRASMV